ncbi:MAG: hypothetical protein ABIP39_11340 [Polyangiaceae bacterium]
MSFALLAVAACVKIPSEVEATFAPPAPHEDDNFRRNSSGIAHASFEHAPPTLAATVPVLDAAPDGPVALVSDPLDGGVE